MYRLTLLAIVAGCTAANPPSSSSPSSAMSGVTVGVGVTADVAVERALYERVGTNRFFIHVRVTNKSGAPLGVDLRAYSETFYVNQWGSASADIHRTAIDEKRLVLPPWDESKQARLIADAHAGQLTVVPTGGALDYYRDFNASSRSDVDAQSKGYAYVLLTIDGQLKVVRGETAERIVPSTDDAAREIAIDAPVNWLPVPSGALVVQDR